MVEHTGRLIKLSHSRWWVLSSVRLLLYFHLLHRSFSSCSPLNREVFLHQLVTGCSLYRLKTQDECRVYFTFIALSWNISDDREKIVFYVMLQYWWLPWPNYSDISQKAISGGVSRVLFVPIFGNISEFYNYAGCIWRPISSLSSYFIKQDQSNHLNSLRAMPLFQLIFVPQFYRNIIYGFEIFIPMHATAVWTHLPVLQTVCWGTLLPFPLI